MAIKRRDFQKLSSTVQEFLLKLPDEESSARLRDNLLHALHFLQLYYRVLQNRDRNTDNLQWTIDHSLSPLTPFREAPDKFEWDWLNVESQKVRQSLPKTSVENFKALPPIITAIKEGNLDSVKSLVEKEPACVNSTDLFTRDCLTYAIQFDQVEILKLLLKHGANTNNLASDSSTSLHRAVYKSNPVMVELLLEYKANINAQDCYNRAPLHWSVVNKEIDCLKVLLKFKPNIHIKDKDAMTPSMWALHLDHLEHFKLINNLDETNVNKRIDFNNLEADSDGRTWLHWSVRKNEPLKCLTFLINNDTALLRDKEGKTCLHIAAEQGAIQASKLIIEMTGNSIINERDNKKQTPLHLATLNGHARGIKILMDNGADPNSKDLTGASPIDYVTKRNLFFCNSIIEICLRNYERKSRAQGVSSQNSIASSFNGSETNLTPAPPTTPKNSYSRTFQPGLGRPPRPVNTSTDFSKTAPANLGVSQSDDLRNTISIPPSPPTVAKTRPNLRNGWNSTERILSGSLLLSRASTRTSLASDDLDKYMSDGNYGSMTNLANPPTQVPALKPIAPPRITSSGSGNARIYSGRAQETQMSSASLDAPVTQAPPPIKPRKSSSVASLNNTDNRMNGKSSMVSVNSNNLNVEDLSDEEEYSITSVKGEGFASDLSDNEIKNQSNPRIKSKKIAFEHNPKRPSTPMDIRLSEQVKNMRDPVRNIKHHHMPDPAVTMTRFNEWDPYRQKQETSAERQKSPLKHKHQSNFAQTFLNVTDSSPRQSSGRAQIGSAGQKNQGQPQSQFALGSANQETNSSSNLDLIISGQKLGSRKDSPTNTPREVSAQPENKRVFSRRLQPLDKNSEVLSSNEGQFMTRQKTSKSHNDRKKLEPLRGQYHNGLNTSHMDTLTHSITETDPTSQTIGNNDDEPSLSENTISSDKQQIIYNVRVNNKKKSGFGKGRKNFIGPIVGNDEALKM